VEVREKGGRGKDGWDGAVPKMAVLHKRPSLSLAFPRNFDAYDHLHSSIKTMANEQNNNVEVKRRINVDPETIQALRERVANSTARKVIECSQKLEDGCQVGVAFTLKTDESFLRLLLEKVREKMGDRKFLFIAARGPPHRTGATWPLAIATSSTALLRKAVALTHGKFLGRMEPNQEVQEDVDVWHTQILDVGQSRKDEKLMWEIMLKSRCSLDPFMPPPGARTAKQLVSAASARFERLTSEQAFKEVKQYKYDTDKVFQANTFHFVDIRSASQRSEHGFVPGSIHSERIDLEHSFDVSLAKEEHTIAKRYDSRIILFDQGGSSSPLAVAALLNLGVLNATDIVGGFLAWKAAGLPIALIPKVNSHSLGF
jgi:rhodanese-related sulfurtransferase